MWNDSEIDMEELEARLYGQVHHPTTEELTHPSFNLANDNVQGGSKKTYSRYFNENRKRESMNNFMNRYQDTTFFKNPERFESNTNITFQHPACFQSLPSFYNSMGYVPEIALNNIVVLPPPASPHIFAQPKSPLAENLRKEKRRDRQREKRRAKRILIKELLQKRNDDNSKKTFREHRLVHNPLSTSHEECEIIPQKDNSDIICLSESDASDCEITNDKHAPPIVLSSDDEDAEKKSEAKNEEVVSDQSDKNQVNPPLLTVVELSNNHVENNVDIKNVLEISNKIDDDDDVILVESKPEEIIIIHCEDSQSFNEEKTKTNSGTDSNPSDSFDNTIETSALTFKEPVNRSGSPESTNDFLENSFNESNDGNLEVNSGHSLHMQTCETESNSSASDIERPLKNSTFIEEEFDVPSQNAFSELTLDSFTNYIGSGGNNFENTLNSNNCENLECNVDGRMSVNKNMNIAEKNSSDSSSESDYDDNKSALIEDTPKPKRRLSLKSRTSSEASENDCFIIENSFTKEKTSTPLPNLSPITSDEETENCKISKRKSNNKDSIIKSKKSKRKKSSLHEEINSSGEKRKYPKEVEEYIKAKRLKEDEIQKRNEEVCKSSDELSEVEVVHASDNENSNTVDRTGASAELLNVSTPTTSKQSKKASKQPLKRFKDYWTEDMKKFYFESWGGENFSVEKAQESMSDSPEMWKIHPSDRTYLKSSSRGPRCIQCNELGHKATVCKAKRKPIKCNVCAMIGHSYTRCPRAICTSCGRKNHCFTTYCSRCANSRRIVCRLCSQNGHNSSRCPDLWRRYHLTTKPGPPRQPFDFNLKSAKNRWCSGCASRGHFEFECDYYNRTHAPNDPTICSYDDLYNKHNSSTGNEMEMQSNNDRASSDFNRSSSYANMSPLIVNNFQNPYMQNLRQEQHSFYQQLPILQSIPSLLSLQPGSNIFCQSPNYISNQFASQNVGGNVFQQNYQLTNSPMKNSTPEEYRQPISSNRIVKRYLKLKGLKGKGLRERESTMFFKELGEASNVKIKILKQKKVNTCYLEGSQQQVANVERKVLDYVNSYKLSPPCLMTLFQGKDFSLNILQESLTHLDTPDLHWASAANKIYAMMRGAQRGLKNPNLSIPKVELEDKLKMRCMALNAVLIGKLHVEDGAKHMAILRRYKLNEDLNDGQIKMLNDSYNYVFKNGYKLNIEYKTLINQLPPIDAECKDEVSNMLESGVELCEKNNFEALLARFKRMYRVVKKGAYKEKHIVQFRKILDTIKNKNRQINAGRN